MPNNKTINLVIFGLGNVGNTLINQLFEVNNKWTQYLNLTIPIISNSNKALFNLNGVSSNWKNEFDINSIHYSMEDILNYVNENKLKNLIALDLTASYSLTKNYIPLVEAGFHIISANKIANTLSQNFYKELRETLLKNDKTFLYETNVGAGLPIIETIKNLYDSGEEIERIRGVFSGSLSCIFNTFSEVITNATILGLTESDAREDLSGNDVARKLLILARELQINKEFEDVSVESLVPAQLNGKITKAQFQKRISELDLTFHKRKQNLKHNQVLRYVGELDVGSETLSVKLINKDAYSTLGQLKGSDSLFEIFTKSYGDLPLVIQGAGAGKDVTARGVLSDIIKLSKKLN